MYLGATQRRERLQNFRGRQATKYNVPRLAFINKMDRVGADFEMSVDSIHKKLGANAWPVLLPLGSEDQLRGQLDVINRRTISLDRRMKLRMYRRSMSSALIRLITSWSNKFPI